MAIVSIRHTSQGEGARRITFIATDHLGVEHRYGPVRTVDPTYDPEVVAPLIAAKIEAHLAESAIQQWLDE